MKADAISCYCRRFITHGCIFRRLWYTSACTVQVANSWVGEDLATKLALALVLVMWCWNRKKNFNPLISSSPHSSPLTLTSSLWNDVVRGTIRWNPAYCLLQDNRCDLRMSMDLIGHIKFLSWWHLNSCVTRSSSVKGIWLTRLWATYDLHTNFSDKATHLTAFCAWNTSPHLLLTPASDSKRSNLWSKSAGTKYLYTKRKLSVSSVEQSPLVVANSVDAKLLVVIIFLELNEMKNSRY